MSKHYGAKCDAETKPVIVVHPGRMFGKPTIGHSRLPVELVADTYWWHGAKEVKAMWGYLTDADILVCCWYVARYGTRSERRRWKDWYHETERTIWEGKFKHCPWPPLRSELVPA